MYKEVWRSSGIVGWRSSGERRTGSRVQRALEERRRDTDHLLIVLLRSVREKSELFHEVRLLGGGSNFGSTRDVGVEAGA